MKPVKHFPAMCFKGVVWQATNHWFPLDPDPSPKNPPNPQSDFLFRRLGSQHPSQPPTRPMSAPVSKSLQRSSNFWGPLQSSRPRVPERTSAPQISRGNQISRFRVPFYTFPSDSTSHLTNRGEIQLPRVSKKESVPQKNGLRLLVEPRQK